MNVPYIPSSRADIERRRLESTLDHDLSSLSLTSSSSFSSLSTIELARSAPVHLQPNRKHQLHHHHQGNRSLIDLSISFNGENIPFDVRAESGLDDTPRPQSKSNGATRKYTESQQSYGKMSEGNLSHTGVGASPISSAGHHVSAATIGAGVFKKKSGNGKENEPLGGGGGEFDPDRSLGRLVGELGKIVNDRPRPVSPFSTVRPTSPTSPRSPSPSPVPPVQPPHLSFSLSRNDPLPSPPNSRSGSGSSVEGSTRFTTLARELGSDLNRAKSRRVLGETGRDNVGAVAMPSPSWVGKGRKGIDVVRRTNSAPVRSTNGKNDFTMDVTGLTALMATPAKGIEFVDIHRNTQLENERGAVIPETLATLGSRINALEMENSVSKHRIKELEGEIEKARAEIQVARRDGSDKLREAVEEKSALETLVSSLRENLSRLAVELETQKSLIADLRNQHVRQQQKPQFRGGEDTETATELAKLRAEVERLAKEVYRLGDVVEQGLNARKIVRVATEGRDEEMDRVRKDVEMRSRGVQVRLEDQARSLPSRLRQGLHTVASVNPSLVAPTPAKAQSDSQPTRQTFDRHSLAARVNNEEEEGKDLSGSATSSPSDAATRRHGARKRREKKERVYETGPESPFPSIVEEEDEREFFAALTLSPNATVRAIDQGEEKESEREEARNGRRKSDSKGKYQGMAKLPEAVRKVLGKKEDDGIPPQTVLARVIRELEDEFSHYKVIYLEIAEQYGLLDAASAIAKRHVLADHLKEVIDTLEHKANQIAALYDLLQFSDKSENCMQTARKGEMKRIKSVGEILGSVSNALGSEARARLERDGFRLR